MRLARRRTGTSIVLIALLTVASGVPAQADDTFTVNSPGDLGDLAADGRCDTLVTVGDQCTLRAAIEEANRDADKDVVTFGFRGTRGVKRIHLGSGLTVTEPLVIDGSTQLGASDNTATTGTNAVQRIVVDCPAATNGLRLEAPATLHGFTIVGCGAAVTVASGAESSVITGMFLGTAPGGMAAEPNVNGIDILGSGGVRIGGGQLRDRNLISGNSNQAIAFVVGPVTVRGNVIGVAADGVTPLGNGGFAILAGANATIGGDSANQANLIAHNGGAGVFVNGPPVHVSVLRNVIRDNSGLAIDLIPPLGVTPNDGPGDVDAGSNGLQNFPNISKATTSGPTTTIRATLNSTVSRQFTIRFFSGPGGSTGMRTFLGKKTVTTNGAGKVTFTFTPATKVGVGKVVSATATDLTTGDTSELSATRTVTAP